MPLRIYRRRILKEILGASSLFVGFVAMLSVSVIGILIKLHAYTTGYYRRLHLGEPNQGEWLRISNEDGAIEHAGHAPMAHNGSFWFNCDSTARPVILFLFRMESYCR